MIPLLILALVVAAGLMMFLRGWTGIRIDDHPICRKCGFDLFGLPEVSKRCSECGADLTRPRAIRDGARARRGGLIVSGLILIAFGGTALALMGWARLSDFDPNPWKSLSWILSDTKPTNALATRAAAFAELRRRIAASELSTAQLDHVADIGLAHQGDRTQTWVPEWGDTIEQLHARQQLSDDRWQRYAKQAGTFVLAIRPKVRRGDPVPVRVVRGPSRVGSVTNMSGLWQEMHFDELTIGGTSRKRGGSMGSSLSVGGSGSGGWNETIDHAMLAKLTDGPQPVRMTLRIMMFGRMNWDASNSGPPIVTYPVTLDGAFELVPSETETVKVVRDPALASGARAALALRDVTYGNGEPGRLALMVDITAPPVTFAHELIARAADGREVKLGHLTCHAGKGLSSNWGVKFPDLNSDRIDIILRPTVAAAHGTTDVFEVWDGEIVIRDVKVVRYDPTTQRTR